VVGRDVEMSSVTKAIADELAKWPRPADGKDGRDGLWFDDLEVFPDGDRGYVLRFSRADVVKEFPRTAHGALSRRLLS
jgi:hypothetical protein